MTSYCLTKRGFIMPTWIFKGHIVTSTGAFSCKWAHRKNNFPYSQLDLILIQNLGLQVKYKIECLKTILHV
jgi:hypothetical protein